MSPGKATLFQYICLQIRSVCFENFLDIIELSIMHHIVGAKRETYLVTEDPSLQLRSRNGRYLPLNGRGTRPPLDGMGYWPRNRIGSSSSTVRRAAAIIDKSAIDTNSAQKDYRTKSAAFEDAIYPQDPCRYIRQVLVQLRRQMNRKQQYLRASQHLQWHGMACQRCMLSLLEKIAQDIRRYIGPVSADLF